MATAPQPQARPKASSPWWTWLRVTFEVMLLAGLGAAVYAKYANPCDLPLHYSLGQLDSRFGIDQKTAIARMKAAEDMWEKRTGRDLLVYDPTAPFKVNFIFDDRQRAIIDGKALDTRLQQVTASEQQMQGAAKKDLAAYQALKAQYDSLLADYEARLKAYNDSVASWNARGGAPRQVYDELQQEGADLKRQGADLEALRQKVNVQADAVNAIGAKEQSVAATYNASVAAFNRQHGDDPDEQGLYVGDAINVYQFLDAYDLTTLLAHEFGHALHVGHENDELSIMNPVNTYQKTKDKDLHITDASLAELRAACRVGR